MFQVLGSLISTLTSSPLTSNPPPVATPVVRWDYHGSELTRSHSRARNLINTRGVTAPEQSLETLLQRLLYPALDTWPSTIFADVIALLAISADPICLI